MRPIVTFAHAVGFVMLLYAVGVLLTPTAGVTGWLDENTFLTPPMLAVAFAICGAYIGIRNPPAPLFSLLTTPLLLYGVAAGFFMLNTPAPAVTALVAHNGLWLVIQSKLYDRARGGDC